MAESAPIPTLDEFLSACDVECGFLVRDHGFERLREPREYNAFSVRFRKGELGVDVYGENWGQSASCDLIRGEDVLPLGLLVPAAERRIRVPKGPRLGQLAQVRWIAERLRQHAVGFLTGDDMAHFELMLAEWKRMTQRRPVTEAHRLERERAQAVTAAGHAFHRSDFAAVIRLLEPHAGTLSTRQQRMLQLAHERLRDQIQ